MLACLMNETMPLKDTAADLVGQPELPTNAHWRSLMRRARADQGIGQLELGRKVGVSQNVISKIETGEQEASSAVVPISRALGIPLPFAMFADELDQRWYEAGRLVRARNERMFRAQVEAMEAFARSLSDVADSSD